MACGRILSATSRKPKVMSGKTFKYVKNPVTKQYVKIRK